MAKLQIAADLLTELLLGRKNFVTVNNVEWDPIYRRVVLDVTGSDVPEGADEVMIERARVESKIVPVRKGEA